MGRRIAIETFLMVATGLLFGLIGPFGTFEMPLVPRVLLWILMILAGYPIFRTLGTVAGWLAEATAVPYWLALFLALTIAAIPMSFIVAALFMRSDPLVALQRPGFIFLYAEVWLVGLVIHGAMTLLMRQPAMDAMVDGPIIHAPVAAKAPVPAHPAPQTAAIEEHEPTPPLAVPSLPLPPGFGPLLALKAEDHYLRAFAPGREELFLMRLRDALAMMPTDAGVQVHRSWWVAKDAVISVARDRRSTLLTLSNGTEVPVARDRMAAIKAVGWV